MTKENWNGWISIRLNHYTSEGDKIFLRLLAEKVPFFSLKLVYDGHDGLISAVLNGKEIKNKERKESEHAEKYRTDEIGK